MVRKKYLILTREQSVFNTIEEKGKNKLIIHNKK